MPASSDAWRRPGAVLALADDLTGALEVGARFSECGLAAEVAVGREAAWGEAPVRVIDTGSRHLPPAEAAEAVHRAIRSADQWTPWLIVKKTDSTLRGPIAEELQAMVDACSGRELVFAAAYPELGRTVVRGRLLVNGIPLGETAFASDALNPAPNGDIRTLVGRVPVEIPDGETEADIRAAAARVLEAKPPRLAAGPAAIAGALAACLGHERFAPVVQLRVALVINGSRHPASAAQIEMARRNGSFHSGWTWFDEEVAGEGLARASAVGERVKGWLEKRPEAGVIVFGGDTAAGIHRAFGAPLFQPLGEILPGVPASRCGGRMWITKAGGFGPPDLLSELGKRVR